MDIIADRERVRDLGKERAEENERFLQHVKQRLPWSDDQVNSLVQEVARKVEGAIDCKACGECCRGLDISVTEADITRLSSCLGMKPVEFTTRFTILDQDGDPEIPSTPCPFLSGSLCSVYAHRPDTCRSYPHLDQDFRSRSHQVLRNAEKCPIVFNTLEELKSRIPWR